MNGVTACEVHSNRIAFAVENIYNVIHEKRVCIQLFLLVWGMMFFVRVSYDLARRSEFILSSMKGAVY